MLLVEGVRKKQKELKERVVSFQAQPKWRASDYDRERKIYRTKQKKKDVTGRDVTFGFTEMLLS